MKTRMFDSTAVAEIGFGCMNLSHAYGTPPSPERSREIIHRALELGVTHFDTASLYGFGRNEELIGPILKPFRKRIYLASKCGITGVDGKRVIDGRPQTLKRTCHESLRRLQTDVIDLYYLHRWDKTVPIEDSVGALADLIKEGLIRSIGLSEISATTLRRAHAIHPIMAVQSEYSLWTRNPEIALLKACDELNVTFVAFSPLGRGFLASAMDPATFVEKDIRRAMPRFCEPHFSVNRQHFDRFVAIATRAKCTPAQLALTWLLNKNPNVIPIPGTTSIGHLEENVRAPQLQLDVVFLQEAERCIDAASISGARYSPAIQLEIDTEEF